MPTVGVIAPGGTIDVDTPLENPNLEYVGKSAEVAAKAAEAAPAEPTPAVSEETK